MFERFFIFSVFKAFPSLRVGNIVRLGRVLRFTNWCDSMPSNNNNIARCETESRIEESVQPYRCLHINSKQEELLVPNMNCKTDRTTSENRCLHAEKWQQLASLSCANKSMVLDHSVMTNNWCGLAKFRGIKFTCCPLQSNTINVDI